MNKPEAPVDRRGETAHGAPVASDESWFGAFGPAEESRFSDELRPPPAATPQDIEPPPAAPVGDSRQDWAMRPPGRHGP